MITEITRVRELVAEGELKEAISLLAQVLTISKSDLQNEVLLFAARFSKLKSQTRKGILSKDQQDLEYARIVNGILEVSEEVSEDSETVQGFVDLKAHLEAAAKKFDVELASYLPQAVIRRIVFAQELGLSFRILWIDDHLDHIQHEKAVLEAMEVTVDVASSSAEAGTLLAEHPAYDLILSDIGRSDDPEAGFSFAADLLTQNLAVPFIFYTRYSDRPFFPPANTFGMAYLPNELYHLVLDVMARKA